MYFVQLHRVKSHEALRQEVKQFLNANLLWTNLPLRRCLAPI